MKKLRLFFVTMIFLVALMICASVSASAEVVGGTCGEFDDSLGTYSDNVIWSFETSTNTLTISGSGAMGAAPWLGEYRSQIFNLVIEDGVTSIVSDAFFNCKGLMNVSLADSIESIGSSAFLGCTGFTTITIPQGVTTISEYTFYDCSNLTQVVFHDNITSIKEAAFYNCGSLQSTILPKNLVTIGNVAFSGCWNLTSLDIPNGVTTIGVSAFYSCENLTSVILPDNLKIIEDTSFAACMKLKMIRIPNSVIQIQNDALNNTALETIVYCGTEAEWNAIAKIASWDHATPNYTISYHRLSCAAEGEDTHLFTCSYCDYSSSEEHIWYSRITTSATHTSYGVKTYTCNDCGLTRTEQIEMIAQHSYDSVVSYDGDQHKKVCSCGSEIFYPHTWDDGKIVKKASNTETGKITFSCKECETTFEQEIAIIHNHEYGDIRHYPTGHQSYCIYCDDCISQEYTVVEIRSLTTTYHVLVCECGKRTYEDHVYEDRNDDSCDICGYKRTFVNTEKKDTSTAVENLYDYNLVATNPVSSKPTNTNSGCGATFSVGSGLVFLIALGAVGVVSKKKKK